MPKLVCAYCKLELRVKSTGVAVVENFLHPPQPYKLWRADLYECPNCEYQVVAGFANNPFAIHNEAGFAEILRRTRREKWVFDLNEI